MQIPKDNIKTLLITGAAGYIGSHACLYALENKYNVIAVDSLERGYYEALQKIQNYTNKPLKFLKGDLRDLNFVTNIFRENQIDAVLHFAAYKSVAEGEIKSLEYIQNNVHATEYLLEAMRKAKVKNIVFSSTAAVYGQPESLPVTENTPTNPINVYGETKLAMEILISNYINKFNLGGIAFRYFNVVGNHQSGIIGEDPSQVANILPLIFKNALGQSKEFLLFGDKHNTKDGTQERDYIDVNDLVEAHFNALKNIELGKLKVFNLSTGTSTTCKELISHVEKVSQKQISVKVVDPRDGDPTKVYSTFDLVNKELNWTPKTSIAQSVTNQWKWISQSPNGYIKE